MLLCEVSPQLNHVTVVDTAQLSCLISLHSSTLKRFRFIFYVMSRSTATVILRWVVYRWRNQYILVGQDSAL